MAIPALTNNSPSAGQIAWGAFSIQYQGVSYTVSAGSTASRWVWWVYNGGSPSIQAGADLPSTLTDDDLVLFGNKNGIGLRVQATSVVDGELLVDGSVFADAIAVNQINSQHIVTAGLDAGVVKFGTMSGDRIATNTLLVSTLVVTDLDNNLDNPIAQIGTVGQAAPGWDGTIPGWFTVQPTLVSATLPDNSTGPVLQLTANGTSVVAVNKRGTAVKPGDQFWVSGYMRKVSGTDVAGNVYPLGTVTTLQGGTLDTATQPQMSVTVPGTDPPQVAYQNMQIDISTLTNGVWVSVEGVYTVPAGAMKSQFYINLGANIGDGVYQFWGLEARRKGGGKLIVDGSITSLAIDTDEVTSAIMQTGLLQAQLTITGVLAIDGVDAGWSATRGLWLTDKVKLFADTRTNQIEGDLVTSSLTIKDGLSIGGNADIHGTVVMGNGITTPTAKMSLGETWPGFQSSMGSGTEDQSNIFHGLYDLNGTEWLIPFQYFGAGLRKVNKSAGAWTGDITLKSWKDKFYPTGGMCVIGGASGKAYLLGHDQSKGDEYYLIRVDLTDGSQLSSIRIGGLDPFNGKRACLVTDGTNVGMIWTAQSTDNLNLRWFTPTLSAQVGSDVLLYTNMGHANVGDAYWGVGNAGGTARLWVSMFTGDSNMVRCWTTSPTAPVRVPAEDFKRANSGTINGLSYDVTSARMVSYDKFMKFSKYSNYITAQTLSAQYSWYDGDTGVYPGAVGSGTTMINGVDKSGTASTAHETTPSPTTTFAMSARAFPTISAPPAPDELTTDVTQVDKANRIGIYASVGSTPRLITYLPVGRRALDPTIEAMDPLSTSGALAGASGVPSFASASVPAPGRFRSAAELPSLSPIIDLYGSGAGRVGPYRWGADSRPLSHGEYATTSAQNIPTGTFTHRTGFANRDGISANGISYSNGVFTVSQSGLYLLAGAGTIAGVGTTNRRAITAIYVNGAAKFRCEVAGAAANQDLTPVASGVAYLPAGATVELMLWHNIGTTQPTTVTDETNFITIYCLAAF